MRTTKPEKPDGYPERKLAMAVIIQALADAFMEPSAVVVPLNKPGGAGRPASVQLHLGRRRVKRVECWLKGLREGRDAWVEASQKAGMDHELYTLWGARVFFSEAVADKEREGGFEWWCDVAGIMPDKVRALIRHVDEKKLHGEYRRRMQGGSVKGFEFQKIRVSA